MKTNQNPPFKVGDRVRTEFHSDEKHIVRNVLRVDADTACQSGWLVMTDGGEPCQHCGCVGRKIFGYYSYGIDSRWFTRVDEDGEDEAEICEYRYVEMWDGYIVRTQCGNQYDPPPSQLSERCEFCGGRRVRVDGEE